MSCKRSMLAAVVAVSLTASVAQAFEHLLPRACAPAQVVKIETPPPPACAPAQIPGACDPAKTHVAYVHARLHVAVVRVLTAPARVVALVLSHPVKYEYASPQPVAAPTSTTPAPQVAPPPALPTPPAPPTPAGKAT